MVNITKLMQGDPNKAAKRLEEDAKQLFKTKPTKEGEKAEKTTKKVLTFNSSLNSK